MSIPHEPRIVLPPNPPLSLSVVSCPFLVLRHFLRCRGTSLMQVCVAVRELRVAQKGGEGHRDWVHGTLSTGRPGCFRLKLLDGDFHWLYCRRCWRWRCGQRHGFEPALFIIRVESSQLESMRLGSCKGWVRSLFARGRSTQPARTMPLKHTMFPTPLADTTLESRS